MAIDGSSLSNKYHFDLTAKFSRVFEKNSSFSSNNNQLATFTRTEKNYPQASEVKILERALGENLGKRIDSDSSNRFDSPVRTIEKNIITAVRQELREARNNGASEQKLQTIIDQAKQGVEQGFSEAKEILQSRLENDPSLERQIERAYSRVQQGLERIDNRFTPNVDSIDSKAILAANQPDEGVNSASLVPVTLQQEVNQTRQIEFNKTRNVERSKSFELSIQTQEGDIINLTIEKSFSKQVVKQASLNDDGITASVSKQVQRDKQISYEVSGDINQQEQAAIDALLKKVNRITDKFFQGNLSAAFNKASRVGIDADQLTNFSLNLQSSRSVEITKTYREVQGVSTAQQTVSPQIVSPIESIGGFVSEISGAANEQQVSNVVADPVPVTTELFKQVAIRDERYMQLVMEQSAEVVDQAIDGIVSLAEQQLAQAA